MQKTLGAQIVLLLVITGALFLIIHFAAPASLIIPGTAATSTQVSASAAAVDAATSTVVTSAPAGTSTPKTATTTRAVVKKTPAKSPPTATTTTSSPPTAEISRIQNPYPVAASSFTDVNVNTRSALVNILCMPRGGSLRPISGSGVLIDSRGIILTNAHVAQYVLLSESPRVNLECYVRTGSPAVAHWVPTVLYIPPVWVEAHAADINSSHPTGTGEHDYALLYITGSVDGSPLPASFPSLSPDTREAIGFLSDDVLVASYPAEFIGAAGGFNIYSASSVTTIWQLFTFFETSSVDVVSVGGVIEAQSGSSGGAIVNAWNRLIGIITTTSDGATTAERDLRAITLSYINRDLAAQTGFDLATTLGGNPAAQTEDFTARTAPRLIQLLLDQILK